MADNDFAYRQEDAEKRRRRREQERQRRLRHAREEYIKRQQDKEKEQPQEWFLPGYTFTSQWLALHDSREVEDPGGEVVGRQGAGEPVDGGAAFFHASEPGHLALGKLMDGDFQLAEHLFLGQLADNVLRDKLVL